jgi:hypothetical protein
MHLLTCLFLIYICTHVPGVAAAHIALSGRVRPEARQQQTCSSLGVRTFIREKVLEVS